MKHEFPIFSRTIHGKPLTYLDNAASTQKPLAVIEAMDDCFVRCGADEAQAGQFGKGLFGGGAQGFFVGAESGDAFVVNPVQRGARPMASTMGGVPASNLAGGAA